MRSENNDRLRIPIRARTELAQTASVGGLRSPEGKALGPRATGPGSARAKPRSADERTNSPNKSRLRIASRRLSFRLQRTMDQEHESIRASRRLTRTQRQSARSERGESRVMSGSGHRNPANGHSKPARDRADGNKLFIFNVLVQHCCWNRICSRSVYGRHEELLPKNVAPGLPAQAGFMPGTCPDASGRSIFLLCGYRKTT
jgi:hypothetical protein